MPRQSNPPMSVTPIATASETEKRGPGRPANLKMPAIPQEILDGMNELEQLHFEHFRQAYTEAYRQKYGKLTPTAEIGITQAALDYIHLWRLQTEQMVTKKLVTQARQNPGTSLLRWLQSAGLQERDFEAQKEPQKKSNLSELLKLSS